MKRGKMSGIWKRISGLSREDDVSEQATNSVTNPVSAPYRLPDVFPNFTEQDLERLNQAAQDYQIVNGGLLKVVFQEHDVSASSHVIGVSLYPSPFPAELFKEACELQTLFQELYVAVSRDLEWLSKVLKDLIASDPLTRVLWDIVKATKFDVSGQGSSISAAICRSDYMIHAGIDHRLQLKQVEFNTIACAGSVHGQRVRNMHDLLYKTGHYGIRMTESIRTQHNGIESHMTPDDNVTGICRTLEAAHNAYLRLHQQEIISDQSRRCILMVVQPNNFNVADERPFEFDLWSRDVPCFRVQWGEDLLKCTTRTSDGYLHFKSSHLAEVFEVSVVYFRAGFEPHEYEERVGYELRVRLETSNAIQCPDILTHLVGSKRVQQALSEPAVLERFIGAEKSWRLRSSFMKMYPLDESDLGLEGRKLATNPGSAGKYVLKPSRDGGGHNVYKDDIPPFLTCVPRNRWAEYVLMEMIEPVVGRNALVSSRGTWSGDIVAELGIWGGCIWQTTAAGLDMHSNEQVGWSVRSKVPSVNEMSVVKGFGCFDSIALINTDSNTVVA